MRISRSPVTCALVGIGGYGNLYLSHLFEHAAANGVQLVAVADPAPSSCEYLSQIESQGIPVYPSLETLQSRHSPELVVISTPLHLHYDQTVAALREGSHVLCEKPLCNSPAEAAAMIRARDEARKQVSIGYQWSFSEAIQMLKNDISLGIFGRPKRLKTLVLWPRDESYYSRNAWAGRRYTAKGQLVFDNPLNNACAHHLHNMLYVLGNQRDRSAHALSINAELYRLNEIDTFDTAAVRVLTTRGVELLCVVSHTTLAERGPWFTFEFELGTVEYGGKQPTAATRDGANLVARFIDGRVKHYGSPDRSPDQKLWAAAESARHGAPTVCGIEAAQPHTAVMAALQKIAQPAGFPDALQRSELIANGQRRRWIEGLDEVLTRCYAKGKLPSELGVSWAVSGQTQRVQPATCASTIASTMSDQLQAQQVMPSSDLSSRATLLGTRSWQ